MMFYVNTEIESIDSIRIEKIYYIESQLVGNWEPKKTSTTLNNNNR